MSNLVYPPVLDLKDILSVIVNGSDEFQVSDFYWV